MGGGLQFTDKIVSAYGGDYGLASAGNHKATRGKLIARVLGDIVGLTGDEGFVDFYTARDNFAIYQDLIAQRKYNQVALYNVCGGGLKSFAVSNYRGLLLGDEAHFIDSFFGADFVDNANQSICDGDKDKEEVLVTADKEDHNGEDKVDKVEDGKGISSDDTADGIRLFFRGVVDLALPDFLGDFCI